MNSDTLLDQFRDFYRNYDQRSMDELERLYGVDVTFSDPLHSIKGLAALKAYFGRMNANLTACRFEFLEEVVDPSMACFKWVMYYQHPSIGSNRPLSLEGVSVIKFADGKVISHEDFYDVGAMLYEQLPVIGSAVRFIKSKAIGA